MKHNQLIKDVPVAQTDQGRYSLRSWLRSNETDIVDTPYTRTKRNVQEILEMFESTVSSCLITKEEESLSTHTSRLTDVRQYEILETSLGPAPFCLRVLESNDLLESCRFIDEALKTQLKVCFNYWFVHFYSPPHLSPRHATPPHHL